MSGRLFLAAFLILTCCTTAHGQYTLIDLGDLSGGTINSYAYDLNNHGQISGSSNSGLGAQAFIWDPVNGMQAIESLRPGDDEAIGFGINDLGQVVGYSQNTTVQDAKLHAFVWDSALGTQTLNFVPGTDNATAYKINNQGTAVGVTLDMLNPPVASFSGVIWDSNRNGTRLNGFPEVLTTMARDINNLGQAVGSNGLEAFLWDEAEGVQFLGHVDPNGGRTQALRINDAGQIVGSSDSALGTFSFIWDETNGIRALDGLPSNHESSSAFGINEAGQVVGTASLGGESRAFIWDADNGMRDLNDMVDDSAEGWTLTRARAINDKGWIAVNGFAPDGTSRAALLTPEPGSMLLLVIIGLSLRRR